MKNLLAILILVGVLVLNGCAEGAAEATDDAGVGADESAKSKVEDGGMEVVAYTGEDGKLLCPVMNNPIESPEDAFSYQDYEGVRYYFCCDGCPASFKNDPAKYAKPSDE